MKKPTFVITQMLDVGTSNPICARVGYQPERILDFTYAPQDMRERIYGANLELTLRLTNCEKILNELRGAFDAALATYLKYLPSTPNYVPSILRVEDYGERLLTNFKKAVLALGQLLTALFPDCPIDFSDSMNDVTKLDANSQTKLVRWSTAKFGANSQFAARVHATSATIRELISKRNAAEHPGGKNGTFEVFNISRVAGIWRAPLWQREPGNSSDVARDMMEGIDAIVSLAESAVITFAEACFIVVDTSIVEIPEDARDPDAPVRYKVVSHLSQPRPNPFQ